MRDLRSRQVVARTVVCGGGEPVRQHVGIVRGAHHSGRFRASHPFTTAKNTSGSSIQGKWPPRSKKTSSAPGIALARRFEHSGVVNRS